MSRRRPNLFAADPKQEYGPMCADGLRRLGFGLMFANPTGQFPGLCPHTNLNPLEAPIDCYWSGDGRYRNTATFFRSQVNITNPAPPPGATNEYFINNGRACAYVLGGSLIVRSPEITTHGQIFRIASDPPRAREVIEEAAGWTASDTDTFANDVARAARGVLAAVEDRNAHHFGDFLKHVADPLVAFDETGFLGEGGEFATARISDLRTSSNPIALIVMTPLSHLADYAIYTSLFANAVFLACKANPTGAPIHCILEEMTALRLRDYDRELITMRGLGCSAEVHVQSRSALAESTSEKAEKTIWGQSDLRSYAAVDNWQDAQEISASIGSGMRKEFDANVEDGFDRVRFGLRDAAEPLISPQALMAMPRDEQIIKIRGMRPIRAKMIPYWDVAGLRDLVTDNPLEGPAPASKPKARLKVSAEGVEVLHPRPPRRFRGRREARPPTGWAINPLSYLWLITWIGLWAGAEQLSLPVDVDWPAMRVRYTYLGDSWHRRYVSCDYAALDGSSFTTPGGDCPFLVLGRGGDQR